MTALHEGHKELPNHKTRLAEFEDVGALHALEEECFPGEHYPRFFFVQAREIFRKTFLLAEDEKRLLVGYILGASSSENPSQAWILSMVVAPAKRRGGVGFALLQAVEKALQSAGVTKLLLSVAEENVEAISLYRKFGFKEERVERTYFGNGQPRIIMSKILIGSGSIPSPLSDPGPPALKERGAKEGKMNQCLNPDHLLGEARTSVTFCSVFSAVSTAIVGRLIAHGDIGAVVTPLLLLCFTIFSLLYSALFYANASGSLSRQKKVDDAEKALVWGNSLSEYFGVYPLICAFPLITWAFTEKMLITLIVCAIDLGFFIIYQFSRCALLSRGVTNRWLVPMVTGGLSALVVLALCFPLVSHNRLHYVFVGLFLLICSVCFIWKRESINRASTAI